MTLAAVLSGAAGYGFVSLGTRHYGADGFAPLAVVWTVWAAAAAMATLPVEQWLASDARRAGQADPALQRAVALAGTVLAVLVTLASRLAAVRLFGDAGWGFPLICGATVLGAAAMGIARGTLHGQDRWRSAAGLLLGENLVRLGLGAVVVTAGGSAVVFGVLVPVGSLLAAPLSAAALRRARASAGRRRLGALAAVTSGMGLEQASFALPPVLVALLGGAPDTVTAVFVVMALARVPIQVVAGAGGRLAVELADAWAERPATWQRLVTATLPVSAVLGVVLLPVAYLLGPPLARALFGPVPVDGTLVAVAAFGSAVGTGGLVLSIAAVSAARLRLLATTWVVATAVMPVVAAVGWAAPGARGVAAFAIVQVAAAGLLTGGLRRSART